MLAIVPSATLLGAEGRPVSVEVHVANGLPAFSVVGLPDEACREARDRVRAALLSSGLPWPMTRITVNLAPSGVRKSGAGLDLAIAVGLLVAAEAVPADAVRGLAFLGELGLDGSVRRVPGIVPLVAALDASTPVVPPGCEAEAALVARREVRSARQPVPSWSRCSRAARRGRLPRRRRTIAADAALPDLADVRGQVMARLALEVAAAGGHHLLLLGPPGAGKTMLAQRLPGLLPALGRDLALETTMIHSAAGLPPPGRARPPAAVAGAAPHGVAGGDGRRRHGQHAPRRGLAWPTAGCSSWTSWASSSPRCSTGSASRSRRASCGSPGPGPRCSSRPASSWWRP